MLLHPIFTFILHWNHSISKVKNKLHKLYKLIKNQKHRWNAVGLKLEFQRITLMSPWFYHSLVNRNSKKNANKLSRFTNKLSSEKPKKKKNNEKQRKERNRNHIVSVEGQLICWLASATVEMASKWMIEHHHH